MSSQRLVKWIEQLLLGGGDSTLENPPTDLLPLVLKLRKKGVSVSHVMRHGGLVDSYSLLVGDLDRCLEHFERNDAPTIQTGAAKRFYNHLTVALARQRKEEEDEKQSATSPGPKDSEIFESILRGDDASVRYQYTSPQYWGELARRLLNDHRSVRGLMPLNSIPDKYIRHAVRLYDVTIKTVGRLVDPLTMYLLPDRTLYVDPGHFGSAESLEAFLLHRQNHPLSESIRRLLHRCVDELLKGQILSILGKHESLERFLTNVLVVHNYLHQVTGEDEPPRLVDVFQRLLAMTKLDYLWQQQHSRDTFYVRTEESSGPRSVVFQLTSKIVQLEKQNAFLMEHLKQR